MIRAGVDAATFGVLLTVYTGAYLVAMSAGGALAHRFGVGQALSVSAIVFGATLCVQLNAVSEAWVAIAQALSLPIAFGAFALALITTAAVTGVFAVLSRAAVSPRKV